MTRAEAGATVRTLARGVGHEGNAEASMLKLLERIASHPHGEELRAALVVEGARLLLMREGYTRA